MATVGEVVEMLGPDAAAGGWGTARIQADLDAEKTPNQIALAWWTYRTANTVNLVSISESGSSRSLSEIHANALAMRSLYQRLVDADVAAATAIVDDGYGRGIRTFSIRRTAR